MAHNAVNAVLVLTNQSTIFYDTDQEEGKEPVKG